MEFHLEQLGRHCRVCGGRLARAKGKLVTYTCKEYDEQLQASFSLSTSQEYTLPSFANHATAA